MAKRKGKIDIYTVITELIVLVTEIACEQATRDNSGTDWGQHMADRLSLLLKKLEHAEFESRFTRAK